jgi:transcriptional regulator with XRE-family HTH domain
MTTEKPRAYVVRDYNEFLQVVDRLRHGQGLNLRALSDRTGGGRQHLGNQLLGKVLPLAPFAWAIAHALGYDIALIPRKTGGQP